MRLPGAFARVQEGAWPRINSRFRELGTSLSRLFRFGPGRRGERIRSPLYESRCYAVADGVHLTPSRVAAK